MKNILCGIIAGCLVMASGIGAADEGAGAKVSQLVGKGEIRLKGTAVWRQARIGMPVREGTDVRCFVESEAEVTFDNGSQVKIGENSVVTLSRLQGGGSSGTASKTTVNVLNGKVWANVKKLAEKQSEFDFETPTAVASIRGTRLGIDVGRKRTSIDVYEGLVEVKRKGSNALVKVSPNTRAVVDPEKPEIEVVDFRKIEASADGKGGEPPFDPYGGHGAKRDSVPAAPDSVPPAPHPGAIPSSVPAMPDTLRAPAGSDTLSGPGRTSIPARPGNDEPPATAKRLALSIVSPAEGAHIAEPLIMISGTATPGARVFVNDAQVTVGRDGAYSTRLPIPDEPSTYSVEVRAELGGSEQVRQRTVVYEPKKTQLILECTSPANGQVITGRTVRISGKTAPRAMVTANGLPVNVSANGIFTGELPVTEQNIGDLQIEVIARGDDGELSKSFNVEISGKSPQINTSVPIMVFAMQGQLASTQRSLPAQLLDRTPGDELTLKIINNGSTENIATEPGRTEQFILAEGRNEYQIQAIDRAGNSSPVVKGTLYFLPNPIIIMLREPSSNPMVYEGVPPVLHPGAAVAEEAVDVEVEIDDGIGNIPQSIKYCKVTGHGQTVLLRNKNDYFYRGKVMVRRGSNQFIVQVEDLTSRIQSLRFEIIVR